MRVLESSYNIRNLPNEDIWFTDPVHPIDSIYNHLATGVIKMAATLRDLDNRQDLKRRRSDSWETRDLERKPREATHSRYGEGGSGRGRPICQRRLKRRPRRPPVWRARWPKEIIQATAAKPAKVVCSSNIFNL
jgi:hypothetical protein